jgi:hypothetical protein
LCGIQEYASAQFLDFLELADGHELRIRAKIRPQETDSPFGRQAL